MVYTVDGKAIPGKNIACTPVLTLLNSLCAQEGRQKRGLVCVFRQGWERKLQRPHPRRTRPGRFHCRLGEFLKDCLFEA